MAIVPSSLRFLRATGDMIPPLKTVGFDDVTSEEIRGAVLGTETGQFDPLTFSDDAQV